MISPALAYARRSAVAHRHLVQRLHPVIPAVPGQQKPLGEEITALTGLLARPAQPLGELGGFTLTVTAERVLASTTVILELDGAPGSELRMTPAEIASADSGKLVVRLESRLSGLETLKTKTLAEISRLTAEADHARDDLRKPFAQGDRLAAARDRAQQIDEQLSRAAAPPRADPSSPAPTPPDWARTALRNPDDPKWLAAAARDGATMTGIPASDTTVGTSPEPPAAVHAASRDFPESNPLAKPATDQPSAPRPPGQTARTPSPQL